MNLQIGASSAAFVAAAARGGPPRLGISLQHYPLCTAVLFSTGALEKNEAQLVRAIRFQATGHLRYKTQRSPWISSRHCSRILMTSELKIEAWARLSTAKPIHELTLPKYGGRVDLRKLSVTKPEIQRTISTAAGQFATVSELTECRNAKWESLDFSGSQLAHLRFFDCEIVDCVFDECDCQDWRMWDTSFQRCTFRGADLRSSSLGAVRHKRNNFSEVDFSGADLTRTAYVSADFERCVFGDIKNVDFQGSLFVDCVFKGELQEVLFYDLGFNGKNLDPNELLRADFSKAKFKYVEFRRLNLETVQFPQDEEHIVFESDFPRILEALYSVFQGRDDIPSRRLAATLGHELKWLGPKQRRGVLSKRDLSNSGGEEGLNEALRVISNMR